MKELLEKEINDQRQACDSLQYSYDRCCRIPVK